MNFTIGEINASETHALRESVLGWGENTNGVELAADDDPITIHFGARAESGAVICISTWVKRSRPDANDRSAYQLRGMATSDVCRGQGVGRRVLQSATDELHARGVEMLWAEAREVALSFYEREGWKVVGDRFEKRTIPHFLIEKPLI